MYFNFSSFRSDGKLLIFLLAIINIPMSLAISLYPWLYHYIPIPKWSHEMQTIFTNISPIDLLYHFFKICPSKAEF